MKKPLVITGPFILGELLIRREKRLKRSTKRKKLTFTQKIGLTPVKPL